MKKPIIIVITILIIIAISAGLYVLFFSEDTTTQSSQTSSKNESVDSTQEQTDKFDKYSAADVVAVLKDADLSITNVQDQPIGDSAAPATEVESKEFVIESITPDGGQILVFSEESGLNSKKAWFDSYPELAPYVYIKGNVMLQLNSSLPSTEAEKYKQAIKALP